MVGWKKNDPYYLTVKIFEVGVYFSNNSSVDCDFAGLLDFQGMNSVNYCYSNIFLVKWWFPASHDSESSSKW